MGNVNKNMNHIKFIMNLFPKAFEGCFEPDTSSVALFDVFFYLKENITILDEKEVIQKLKKIDYYFKNTPTQKNEFDIYMTYIVGFIENIIDSELRFLIPNIITKADFIKNKNYFLQWVGKESYEKTLKFYN